MLGSAASAPAACKTGCPNSLRAHNPHDHQLTRRHLPWAANLIPRTRKELQAFPERCRRGEVYTWVHFTDKYWPDWLKKRDYHSASTLMLLWWAVGFCYTYWYSFDLLTWSSTGETVFMWGILLPAFVVLIFSRCGGTCKVDEPGWEEAQRAERLDDKPPGIGAVKTAQPAPEAAAAFAPTI